MAENQRERSEVHSSSGLIQVFPVCVAHAWGNNLQKQNTEITDQFHKEEADVFPSMIMKPRQ